MIAGEEKNTPYTDQPIKNVILIDKIKKKKRQPGTHAMRPNISPTEKRTHAVALCCLMMVVIVVVGGGIHRANDVRLISIVRD